MQQPLLPALNGQEPAQVILAVTCEKQQSLKLSGPDAVKPGQPGWSSVPVLLRSVSTIALGLDCSTVSSSNSPAIESWHVPAAIVPTFAVILQLKVLIHAEVVHWRRR